MAIEWSLASNWGTAKLGMVAPEESSQIKPSDYPSITFNYWSLDAIEKNQFVEPPPNLISGCEVLSTCVQFGTEHVLYSKLRPYLNKVVVPSIAGIGTTEWIVLKPNPELVDRHYLAYVLRTKLFVDYATANSTGARMPRARKDALWDADIPVPYPDDPVRSLEIQCRIVARIEALLAELRAARELHRKVAEDTERLMQAVLSEVFPDPESGVPDGWKPGLLGEIANTTSGGTPSRRRPEYFAGEIPWVKSGELSDGIVRGTEEHLTLEAIHDSNAKLFSKGTLLIAMYGATVGKLGILGMPAATNQAICAVFPKGNARVRTIDLDELREHSRDTGTGSLQRQLELIAEQPLAEADDEAEVAVKYLFWYLLWWRRRLVERSIGGAQPNISQRIVKQIPIVYPRSRSVQDRIIAHLDEISLEIQDLREIQARDRHLLGQMEQSLLAQAFRGEL